MERDRDWENPVSALYAAFGEEGMRRLEHDPELVDTLAPRRGQTQMQAAAVVADQLMADGIKVSSPEALRKMRKQAAAKNPKKKKTAKKKAKKFLKKAEKVAKTKSGRIGIGAGAGALLLGPIGAIGGALYGAHTAKKKKEKKKNPGYELNPTSKKKFTWSKKKITPGPLSSDGIAYLTPRIIRGEDLKWAIMYSRKRWHTYLIDGYTGEILGKQGAGAPTLAAAKKKAVAVKTTKLPKGTKFKKEKRANPKAEKKFTWMKKRLEDGRVVHITRPFIHGGEGYRWVVVQGPRKTKWYTFLMDGDQNFGELLHDGVP